MIEYSTGIVAGTQTDHRRPQRQYEIFLKVNGWASEYPSVGKLLQHLSRKSRSESSRVHHLRNLYHLCVYSGLRPDEIITLPKEIIESTVQGYVDKYKDEEYKNDKHALTSVNTVLGWTITFFSANGYKNNNSLNVERVYVPARYRKRPEYIPTKNEVYDMADSTSCLRDRAMILTLYTAGLRNSTFRALLFQDIKDELMRGYSIIRLPVYIAMKQVIPNACKNNIEYYSYVADEATKALRLYIKERWNKFGEIKDTDPLFCTNYNRISKQQRNSSFLTSREVQYVVKESAKKAGIAKWEAVHPHCLRKAFESVLHTAMIDNGNLDPKLQTFFLGHLLAGSDDTYFDKSKIEEFRNLYSKLNFGRVIVENKFKTLRAAVSKAFEGSGIDYEQVIHEYVELKSQQKALVSDIDGCDSHNK